MSSGSTLKHVILKCTLNVISFYHNLPVLLVIFESIERLDVVTGVDVISKVVFV